MGLFNREISRRRFIKDSSKGAGLLFAGSLGKSNAKAQAILEYSRLYMAADSGPSENMKKVIELMGGIESLIGPEDIVVIKTNTQRYNQGTGNLAAMKQFVDMILEIPGFSGEVMIGDNNHRWPADEKGSWAEPFSINSNIPGVNNLLGLLDLFHSNGQNNVTKFIWNDSRGEDQKQVFGPGEGDGYVFMDDVVVSNGAENPEDYRETIMTYPIFTSSYSGITIDFKNGAWKDGQYIDKPVKFIIFSGLCRHSYYVGTTSAVKNYMGIVDLSGGSDIETGKLSKFYYNFHAFAFNANQVGPVPGVLGDAIGTFMRTVRKADLHITTAEWVGWGDREDPEKAEQVGQIWASSDPVALDFYCTKYVLYPSAVKNDDLHKDKLNVDDPESPTRQYLEHCQQQGFGTIDEEYMLINDPQTSINSVLFSIDFENNQHILKWTVEPLDAFYGFEVQKKDINSDFSKVAYISSSYGQKEYQFAETDQNSSGNVQYRLKLIEKNGEMSYSNVLTVDVKTAEQFLLHPNYPNPFNSNTILTYNIPSQGQVNLSIYNINGKLVRQLVNEEKSTGSFSVQWNGLNDYGNSVSSGTFFAMLKYDNMVRNRTLLFIK